MSDCWNWGYFLQHVVRLSLPFLVQLLARPVLLLQLEHVHFADHSVRSESIEKNENRATMISL